MLKHPIGITQVLGPNNSPIDLPSIYSKKETEDTNKIPTNNCGEFTKYFVGGKDADDSRKGKEAWEEVCGVYCTSQILSTKNR